MSLLKRIVARHLQARATPLPDSFPKTEIGLMTADEFLEFRNPEGKMHPSDAYDFDVLRLNQDYAEDIGTTGSHRDKMVTVARLSDGYRVRHDDEVIAIIHNGTAYYDKPHWKREIPTKVWDRRDKATDLGVRAYKQVKYLAEVAPLISPVAKHNSTRFPVVLQHILVKGEAMTVRAEKQPSRDKGETLVVFNSDGLIVAQASDEWGATLIAVAREYRGKGLGKVLGRYWYEFNPSYRSGGFTQSGERNALALWRERVHEFSSLGWYSALIREGRISYDRVKEILAGAGERPLSRNEPEPTPEEVKATGEILVYADDITVVVYDRAFLDEPDERFVHGYGFYRDTPETGPYIFAIDYDRPFADITTRAVLQLARDNGERIYDGEGYHDMIEADNIPGLERDGDYITITRDLIPLRAMAQKEQRLRKAVDPYREKHDSLLEIANYKWR